MTDRLEAIFESKRKSSEVFRQLQAKLGMVPEAQIMSADPLTREGTIELHKGLHWINVELSEFMGAAKGDQAEELADVLHFLIEFCILSGLTHDVVTSEAVKHYGATDRLEVIVDASKGDPFVFEDPVTNTRFMILAVLQVAELLKNKPWKQTLRPLDRPEFDRRVAGMFYWFGTIVRTTGLDSQGIFDQFMRKEKINYSRVAGGV